MSSQKIVSVAIVLLLLTGMSPAVADDAQQYGMISGKVMDKNGIPISGVTIEAYDNSGKLIETVISGEDGKYTFSRIVISSSYGNENCFIKAYFEKDGKKYGPYKSLWFVVYPLKCTIQDVTFDNYPPSGTGRIYGLVSEKKDWISSIPATIYLSNNMYSFFGGSINEPWQFWLPEGNYEVWAEYNVNGKTYVSDRYPARVTSDSSSYILIYLPRTNSTNFKEVPLPGINIVRGQVVQGNDAPLPGVYVELCKVEGKSLTPIMFTTSNKTGYYEFRDIKVNTVSENYVVRFNYDCNGKYYTENSRAFTIYYQNTLDVSHDIDISYMFDFVDSGSISLTSVPSGASVVLDDVKTGYTTPYVISNIKTGQYTIVLSKEGYFDEKFTVDVKSDTTTNVTKNMRSNMGSMAIHVSPGDASVYINDVFAGKGNIDFSNKPYGKYSYLTTKDGYRNESGTFEIMPGENDTLDINMVAIPGLSLTYISYLIDNMFYSIGKIFTG